MCLEPACVERDIRASERSVAIWKQEQEEREGLAERFKGRRGRPLSETFSES